MLINNSLRPLRNPDGYRDFATSAVNIFSYDTPSFIIADNFINSQFKNLK